MNSRKIFCDSTLQNPLHQARYQTFPRPKDEQPLNDFCSALEEYSTHPQGSMVRLKEAVPLRRWLSMWVVFVAL
jgi:hypothetical protein